MSEQITRARELIEQRLREIVPEGAMSPEEERHLEALEHNLKLILYDTGKYDPAEQCPECAVNGLIWDEVDVGVGVLTGPPSCTFCGWSAEEDNDGRRSESD